MQNQDTWDFAHKICGRIWRIVGSVLLFFTLLVNVLLYVFQDSLSIDLDLWVCLEIFIQTAVLIGSIFPVERALKNNFDEKGNRILEEK